VRSGFREDEYLVDSTEITDCHWTDGFSDP
jgi:hypothetical protein